MNTLQRLCALIVPFLILSALPAAAQPPGALAKDAPAPTCDRSNFRVLVDVGHTNGAGGALSSRGTFEYEFNLRLASEIEDSLLEAGFTKAMLMVSTERPTAGLFHRAAAASSLRADLFLSIHHDAVPDRFIEKWDYEGVTREYSDRFKGHSIFISRDNRDYGGSLLFGQMLGNSLKARGLQFTPHYVEKFMGSRRRILVDAQAGVYRYDQLIVLRHTQMPAVLLEAGSIVNRDEELELARPERRALISAAATEAVETFCAARINHQLPLVAQHVHNVSMAMRARAAHPRGQRSSGLR
jgi:N-acetylmuramoyl-L-alanine amidase